MIEYLTKEMTPKYHEFLKNSKKGHFMQTKMWAAVKDNWKNEVILSLDKDKNIVGAISILIRKIPFLNRTIMYSPRGPVCDIYNKEVLGELIGAVKKLAKRHKSYVLKIDPDVKNDDLAFKSLLGELGFKIKDSSKNFEGIQPRFVFRLDIKDKTEDEALAAFHSKTRYNIRLSERKGVVSRVGKREDLAAFHKIMVETGQRDEFVIRNLPYFEKMFDALAPDNLRLYMASHNNEDISGSLAVYYGNKVWYLYGASSNSKRNLMPNYLLQWEMIKWAIEKKCDIYDFRGVSGDLSEDNPLYGLYRFKKGFCGELTEFIGEAELVFNKPLNAFVNFAEKVFRELRRRIYLLRGKNNG